MMGGHFQSSERGPAMQRDGWKSGLVWVGLTVALCGVVMSTGRDDTGTRQAAAPGHEAGACGVCRAHPSSRGPALPYELDDENIRFIPPVARAHGHGSEDSD